ncbi:pao retrotransposon peptidase domain-containing protein [Phthorimaea operculella]|nr:pao retrotransposon peptidase domain-containing protein [Phthorimaea operculella]
MTHNGIDLEELIHPFVASKEVCLLRVQYLYELAKKIGELPKCDLSNPSVAEFAVRAQDLGSLRIEFERCVSEINAMSKRHLPEFVPSYKEVQEFDILYYEIKKVASCISSSVKTEPKVKNETTGAEAKCRVKLPELQIYKFDGKVENWTTFRDTFRTLIHENSTISNIEKYYYLLSSVSGQALSIVKSMPVSGDNYAIVWSALQKRYENKRMLATAYLDKMFNFKPMTETASNLNNFVQTYQENMIALEQLGIPYMASFILFYVALRSLDPVTRREFEQTMAPGDIPNMTDLLQFVERQARVLEMTECKIASIKSAIPTKPSTSKSASTAYQNSDASKSSFTKRPSLATGVASADNSESRNFHTCLYCQKPHSIYRCIDYNNLTPEQRTAKVIELKLCENCLRDDHTVAECTSKYSCTVCKKRHHVTLHMDSTDTPKEDSVTLMCSTKRTVLLGTANIHVADAWGQYHLVRAVIDGGAMSSFITQDLAKKLGLTRRKCNFEPVGLGGNRVEQFGLTTCTIKPRNNSEPIMTTDSVIVSNIAGHLPTTCLPNNVVSQFQNLELADPAFHQPATVDMLIAGDLFPYIYTGEKIFPAESGMPVAMNSIFGYIIGGAAVINNENQKVSMVTTAAEGVTESIFCGFTGTMNMDQIMNRFWEVENIPSEKPKKPDDILAEELFAQEHSRDESGRYIVRYPFRPDHELGESRQIAVRRLCNLEAKLDRDPQLKEEYHKFMSEYESLGHMTCLGEMPNKLWAVQLDWDQSLPPHLESEWITFVKELPLLSVLQHERHVMVKQSIIHRILGFCDASTLGYAAVVYLFTENENNTLSVPRLELMAAHLLAKLVKYVALILQERDVCIDDILLFTDSSVVLAWLNTPSYKLKIFVATRVTKILETFPANHWRHVSGESNPADVCSRGALPSTLMAMSEWLHGPHWILNEKWPVRNIDEFRDENPPEMKHSTESKNLLSAEPPRLSSTIKLPRYDVLGTSCSTRAALVEEAVSEAQKSELPKKTDSDDEADVPVAATA